MALLYFVLKVFQVVFPSLLNLVLILQRLENHQALYGINLYRLS